jgi:hypothetical protein
MLLQTSGVTSPQQNKEASSCQLYVRSLQDAPDQRPNLSDDGISITLKAQCKTPDNTYIIQVTFDHLCVMQLFSKLY